MSQGLTVRPTLCIGCSTCVLTCSLHHTGEFNRQRAHIKIIIDEFNGCYQICLASTCRDCGLCAASCPTGALSRQAKQTAKGGEAAESGRGQ
ncbi:MAG: 4Fe-4S binding protein [Bacillota bacterium]|uniref:4Fe-4S binding protein n=1 Tax=Desulfurispora thermophila TaxID=265470 RepID=UPI0003774727|nr:4Fe-4S binding protein [Desulfurispora thermophila]